MPAGKPFVQVVSWLPQIAQKTIIHATGYGARALWKDESIVPVRGQIAWLIPRRDGIVVQSIGGGEMYGYNDANEAPDRAAAEAAVGVLVGLYGRMKS